ncbi:hypothetical protein AAVH_13399 [Aphelenchoides avenae]|nr:hypothetical protein AAVH_13399 [Aphelenchus avenae]
MTAEKSARRYVAKIWVEAYDGHLGQFVNKDTSEVLIVSLSGTRAQTDFIEVERKPVDDMD